MLIHELNEALQCEQQKHVELLSRSFGEVRQKLVEFDLQVPKSRTTQDAAQVEFTVSVRRGGTIFLVVELVGVPAEVDVDLKPEREVFKLFEQLNDNRE